MGAKALISGIFAFIAGLLVAYDGTPFLKSIGSERTHSDLESLEVAIMEKGNEISSLRSQLSKLTIQMEQLSESGPLVPSSSENRSGISDRLSALEKTVETMRSGQAVLGDSDLGRIRDRMVDKLGPQPIQQSAYRQNLGAEELFEADSAPRLDEQAQDTISEIFHASDSMEMRDIYCKESVCKITYSKLSIDQSGGGTNDESEFVLIEQLSDGMGGVDLDIRYARDDQGNEIMYVQLD